MVVRVAGRAIVADPRLAWRAVHREAVSAPRALKAWLAMLSVLILVGAAGAIRSIFPGDKGTATTPTFEWGILIVGYVFFAVTTSGLCLASSLGTVFGIERFRPLEKRHAILAVLCLVTAFGVIALDLHYPVRLVFGAALNPSPTSPMWWMGVFYGIYLCFLLVEVWSMFWGHPRIHGMACVLASCMAIIAPTTLGAVFGVVSARPYWAGVFTPLLMLATAFLSGTALLGVVFGMVDRLHLTGFERAGSLAIPAIRSLLALGLVIAGVLVAREVIVGLTSGDPGLSAATRALVSGPLAIAFIGVRVVIGLALPMVLIVLPRTRTALGLSAAGCLAIVGAFADRLTFVSAGQISPLTAVSGVVSTPYAAYTPSPVEISILIGAVALIAMVYTLAERYLDLRESDVHVGFTLPVGLRAWRLGSVAAHLGHVPGRPAHVAATLPEPTLAPDEHELEPIAPMVEPAPTPAASPTDLPASGDAAPDAMIAPPPVELPTTPEANGLDPDEETPVETAEDPAPEASRIDDAVPSPGEES
jgi:molybdopterin-containing oxidoreductase family membrane subunit